ncbi:ribulose-phosphate 3-epimerase [Rufibacter quisquiliarum]|uniref:Ribulose-phosphate 3-epimerase n=1 Tax=Rufibacter quisquiliarum TaxID=1549639 RepID=A0A839GFV0_9BACT|nr:ribulose-phosphate 3-epimerase [Rufibacter quisquiliarum]MBA9077410.1 ribulose-phosphate 3-epimerase [Rufibacter quisquiliarum]
MPHFIAPSVLAANFGQLATDVQMLNNSTSDWIHVDIMDGRFVPNISFGFPVVQAIQKVATKPLDVHLMIEQPEQYIEQFRAAGAEYISVHYEACPHLHRTLQQIKATGAKAGVALNPHTSVQVLADVIQDLDLVILMSVNPGFGGQKFIQHTYKKIEQLKAMIQESQSACLIEVDGGVNQENAPALLKAGADVLVAGSFVFNSANPTQTIHDLKQISF